MNTPPKTPSSPSKTPSSFSKTPSSKPSSPCTKVCILDGASGLCVGCGRTRDEIALWGSLPEPRRLAIMAGLPARLREAGLSAVAAPA